MASPVLSHRPYPTSTGKNSISGRTVSRTFRATGMTSFPIPSPSATAILGMGPPSLRHLPYRFRDGPGGRPPVDDAAEPAFKGPYALPLAPAAPGDKRLLPNRFEGADLLEAHLRSAALLQNLGSGHAPCHPFTLEDPVGIQGVLEPCGPAGIYVGISLPDIPYMVCESYRDFSKETVPLELPDRGREVGPGGRHHVIDVESQDDRKIRVADEGGVLIEAAEDGAPVPRLKGEIQQVRTIVEIHRRGIHHHVLPSGNGPQGSDSTHHPPLPWGLLNLEDLVFPVSLPDHVPGEEIHPVPAGFTGDISHFLAMLGEDQRRLLQ